MAMRESRDEMPREASDESERAESAANALARRRRRVNFYRVAILVVGLALWEILARVGVIDPFFFAAPSLIAKQLWDWIKNGTSQGPLLVQIWVTLEETLLGFGIGAVLGVVFGILLGRNRLLADIFSVYIKVANSIPRIVLGSIFGNAFQGVREADRAMIANARILGASPFQVTTAVVIPSAMSWILASLHVSFGFALVGAVVGEFLGSRQGLGLLIATEQGLFSASGVFAAMIVLAVVGLAAEMIITWIENRLIKWRPAPFSETETGA